MWLLASSVIVTMVCSGAPFIMNMDHTTNSSIHANCCFQLVNPEPFALGSYLKNALDLKVWGFAALFGLTTTNTYASMLCPLLSSSSLSGPIILPTLYQPAS